MIDKHKSSIQSNKIEVVAGNASPKLNIKLAGNRSFYFTGKAIEYQVMVSDEGAVVNKNTVYVANSYNKGSDLAGSSLGHQVYSETQAGQALMLKSDCQACHQMDKKSVGPSFKQVSAKYQKDPNELSYLSTKIINGGSGVWGPVAMSAHPTISESDSKKIAQWVLSLENAAIPKASLPMLGKIIPEPTKDEEESKNFNLFASYTDQGAFGLKPLTSTASVILRSNKINARELVDRKNIALKDSTNSGFLVYPENNGWIKMKQIDLIGINAIELSNISSGLSGNYSIELRLDSEKGLLIGKSAFVDNGVANSQRNLLLALKPVIDKKLHTLYVHIIADPKNAKKRPLLRSLAFIPTK